MQRIATVGIASGLAGKHRGCWRGPLTLRDSLCFRQQCQAQGVHLDWQGIVQPNERAAKVAAVTDLCRQAENHAAALMRAHRPFLFVGGDHSNAMGIWKGVMSTLPTGQQLGLLWIDAHMDAHTFVSSPSGNIHGMPVAALLGQSDPGLAKIYGDGPVMAAENLVLLGVRSYEAQEQALLRQLGVRVVEMEALRSAEQLVDVVQQSINTLLKRVGQFAISIDLDGIDPVDAPAVATPEPGGISGQALCQALATIKGYRQCVGLEIAEYDPRFDHEERTLRLIAALIGALYGRESMPNRSLGLSKSRIRSTL